MELASLIVLIGAMIIAGFSAVAALVQANLAVSARKAAQIANDAAAKAQLKAEEARDESQRLAKEANDSFDRLAAAQERLAELEEAKTRPSVKWRVSRGKGDTQITQNVGDARAYDVKLTGTEGVHTDEDSSAEEVGPGDSLEFYVWRGGEMPTPRLSISWSLSPGGEQISESVAVRAR